MYPKRFSSNGIKRQKLLFLHFVGILMGLSVVAGVVAQELAGYRESLVPLPEAELVERAHDRDFQAQHQLAARLAEGRGAIPQNISQSLFWYERAAKNGLRPRFSNAASSPTVELLPAIPLRNHHSVLVSAPSTGSTPEVIISVSASEVSTQQAAVFDASLSGGENSLVLFSWDFGNGETAQGPIASTEYSSPGTYVASAIVMDSAGQFARNVVTINVSPEQDELPLADFLVNSSGDEDSGFTFLFTSTSTDDNAVISWLWNFGDGNSSENEVVSHTFAAPGTYDVSLLVTDDAGQTATTNQSVEITDPAPVSSFSATPT